MTKPMEITNDNPDVDFSSTFILDHEDWKQFVEIMDAPVEVNANLKSAVEEFKLRKILS